MSDTHVLSMPYQKLPLWDRMKDRHKPLSLDLELTARCNNDCRHCYIALPADDAVAREKELSLAEIEDLAGQAVSMGALWCLLTGGEPLLRPDLADIYMMLKRKGLLVSVFTNACLVAEEHVQLFRRYPPRDIEVTVYGITEATYERVTRRPGSYAAFRRGLDRLLQAGIRVRLKAMALRSNIHEFPEIARFCRDHTADYYRFDPLLHLRLDGDERRNEEIRAERLSPQEIVAIEQADEERSAALRQCHESLWPTEDGAPGDQLFYCNAGNVGISVSYDGLFRLCSSLCHPDCQYDLRRGTLAEAWNNLAPRVRGMRSQDPEFLSRCRSCNIVNLCLWCPAHAHLESGRLDAWCEYFCQVAHARAEAIGLRTGQEFQPEAQHG